MQKARAGIQSVEVGFALLDALARAAGPLMLRLLADVDPDWDGPVACALRACAGRLSADLGHTA